MKRLFFLALALLLAAPAGAQDSAEMGQMRLYVQQLEERIRQLTGENEQLTYQLNQLRAGTGQGGLPAQTGALGAQQAPAPVTSSAIGADPAPGLPAGDFPAGSVAADDPLIAPDGDPLAGARDFASDGPIDLSTLAGGDPSGPAAVDAATAAPDLPAGTRTAALSGSARDEYDLAYGYVLTGDYDLAEESFRNWLAAFPSDPQATDAQFWMGESQYQQGAYRDAANSFLAVYKTAGQSPKAPDALMKLGMSLSALGERPAACATLAEVERRYPQANTALLSRVDEEADRAGC